jgi:hypothetical protein
MRRLAVLNQTIVVLGSAAQLRASARSEPPTKRTVAETVLIWSLPLNLGALETLAFVRQVLRDDSTAEGVDQPPGDRLRSELAVTHLAFGVLGLLSIRFRSVFWFATIVGHAIYLGGVAAVNASEMSKDKMYSFDVLMSLAHVSLLKAYGLFGQLAYASVGSACGISRRTQVIPTKAA